MHICFPSLSYRVKGAATSGVGSQVSLLARALVDAGYQVSVIDLAANKSDEVIDDRGVIVYQERAGNFHWYVSKLPLVGKICAAPLREIEYSIAVWRGVRKANNSCPIDLVEGTETGMALVSLSWKGPVIIRLHGEQYTFRKYTPGMLMTTAIRCSRLIQRVGLRRAKLLISPSHAHAREIRDELSGSHPPLVVIPNALAIEKSNGLRQTAHPAKTVLYAGRIEQQKGIGTLLHAAAKTRDVLPESRFVFAGDFNSSVSPEEFHSLVRKHNLQGNVDLLGPVGWNRLTDLYQSATVAVLPSHYETFGLAALEPMAFGTPVVASSSSSLPEVVINETNGKLVAPGDCSALADAMIEMLTQPDTRERMSRAAKAHAENFDIKRLLPLNESLYQWCVQDSLDSAVPHIFFSPHLDDAVLSCGGVIDRLVSNRNEVRVITVFGGDDSKMSALARHLHAKWAACSDTTRLRREEDEKALQVIGVTNFEHWTYPEAPYRHGPDGDVLYATYDELRTVATKDRKLVDVLTKRILEADYLPDDACLYFPLSLGDHADHQILFDAGMALAARGRRVRFYEDFPYAEKYDREKYGLNWLPVTVSIDLARKATAASAYVTQLPGLGGSVANLKKRLRTFSLGVESRNSSERLWERPMAVSIDGLGVTRDMSKPLNPRERAPRLSDFKNFLRGFRWGAIEDMLPVGSGNCLDLGCGTGRHRGSIESRGYEWIGIDEAHGGAAVISDATSIPLPSNSQAAVVAWQVLEYINRPEDMFAEVARVLESGGVFCGSVSFLEPLHGRTYYNLSPLILERLLKENGFADIDIQPGLNGFALMIWTWLRRAHIPATEIVAIPLAFVLLVPLAAFLFSVSWFTRLLGFGRGHFMRWISQTAPLEFAGHLMFSARKRGRN